MHNQTQNQQCPVLQVRPKGDLLAHWKAHLKENLGCSIAEVIMKIAVGADSSYGFDLKQAVKEYLINKGIEIEDVAINKQEAETPYYQIASEVAQRVGSQQADRGILVCGTGMGMAIIANKHPGVYAAVCENTNAAEKSRSINNSNVLTLGGFITPPEVAVEIVDTWLTTEFTSGWEPPIQEWLENSIKDIAILENEQFGSATN